MEILSDDKAFGERIKILIRKVGSADKLGKLSKISGSVIGSYSTGSADPTRKKLIALAKAANVSVEWLATGIGPEQPTPGVFNRELLIQTVTVLVGSLKKRGLDLDPDKVGKASVKLFEILQSKGVSLNDVESIEKETNEMLDLILPG